MLSESETFYFTILEIFTSLVVIFLKSHITPRRQPQCGIYLLFLFFTTSVCRFGECQPQETARIARLTACVRPA